MSIRLKNTTSGVTVEVAAEKVERLGSGWRPIGEVEPAVEPAAPAEPVEPKRAPGRPKKAPTSSE